MTILAHEPEAHSGVHSIPAISTALTTTALWSLVGLCVSMLLIAATRTADIATTLSLIE